MLIESLIVLTMIVLLLIGWILEHCSELNTSSSLELSVDEEKKIMQ